jgi:glycogen(starch) synthase
MKVLMFGWEFPPLITGGLGTACHGLSTSLARLVEKITFVLPKVNAPYDAQGVHIVGASEFKYETVAQVGGMNLEIFNIQSSLRPYLTEDDYVRSLETIAGQRTQVSGGGVFKLSGDYGNNLLSEVFRYAAIASIIAANDAYDVIHAHDWMTFPAGIEAKRRLGVPLIAHVHALEFDRSGDRMNQSIFEIERQGMEAADRIIAVSHRTADLIVDKYGITAEKITVVHNGIAPLAADEKLRRQNHVKGKLVVFLGRITMQKGPEYFLEAAYLAAREIPEVRFVMAGCGDMMPRMIDRMAELNLIDRFFFTGFLDEKKRDHLFSIADLFVMTSVSEPFGLTPVEAIQHDVPVIVTKQAGVAEVLFHTIKVDFWDTRRIADAIIKILSEPSLSRQMIEGSRKDLDGITWELAANKVFQIYKELA